MQHLQLCAVICTCRVRPAWPHACVRDTMTCVPMAQAAVLAQKDSVTPLLVVLVSASANLLGEFLLIAVRAAPAQPVGQQCKLHFGGLVRECSSPSSA